LPSRLGGLVIGEGKIGRALGSTVPPFGVVMVWDWTPKGPGGGLTCLWSLLGDRARGSRDDRSTRFMSRERSLIPMGAV
jgi:hypothetical protein